METLTLSIAGMSCGHCVAAVRTQLDALDGAIVRDVTIGRALVDVDPSKVSAADLSAAIEEAGFTLASAPGAPSDGPRADH